ncbi:uncharacterized protein LOC128555160 [Mercenaria mercenaria]|uniref:uncharacterized protein LOC128555160 n=1 Tax=Mercenaria mercenaria TaxID=6596 RepID=UPI00234F6214|nr:uncharacterized protein LOC128555160 [Mercenaria mercenaria]
MEILTTASVPVDRRKYSYRYYSLITDVGGYICRSILYYHVGGLPEFLTRSKTDIEDFYFKRNGKPKILNQSQLDVLFPDGKAASTAEKFDLTLVLFLLSTYTFRDRVSNALWKKELHEIDRLDNTPIAYLARIKCYRNKINDLSDTSVGLSEKDFWEFWGELTRIFLQLGHFYTIPNICEMIDKVLHAPFDTERENELEREIQDLRDDLGQIKDMDKTVTEMFQTVDVGQSDMKEQLEDIKNKLTFTAHSQEEVRDVLADEYFVKTKQYHEARQLLLENKIIVLNGAPGEGKTTMAKKLVSGVSNVAFKKVSSRADWENITFDNPNVDAVLIDDMFGAGVFDKEECRKWQKLLPSIAKWVQECPETPRYVVITSRTYILKEAMKKLFLDALFTETNICTLFSYKLSSNEKKTILHNHFKYARSKIGETYFLKDNKKHADLLIRISELELQEIGPAFTIGFPECARLFASNAYLYRGGIKFFEKPMKHILKCVSEICRNDDVYIAFFVLWAQLNRTIRTRDLEQSVQATPLDIKDPILKLQYRPQDHLRKMREVLYNHVHKAGFIRLDLEERFQFSHDVVRDAVGLIAFERNPTAVLSLCDKDFIKTYIKISSEPHASTTNLANQTVEGSKVDIRLPPSRFDQLSLRIAVFVIPGNLHPLGSDLPLNGEKQSGFLENHSVFQYEIFENEGFCSAFIKANREQEYLKTLLTTPLRRIDSELVKYKFIDLTQVNTEIGLSSFLLWRNEKVTFLARQCYQEIKKYPNVLQQELFIALLIACAVGSHEMADFILTNGGQINSQMILMAYDKVQKQQSSSVDHLHQSSQTDTSERQTDETKFLNFLLEKASLPDSSGYFPIHLAALEGCTDIIREILWHDPSQAEKRFTSSNQKSLKGTSLYHIAAFKQNKDLIDILLSKKVPVNVDSEERTPFLYAVHNGKSRVAEKLMKIAKENGDEMLPDMSGNTPLHIAITKSVTQKDENSRRVFKEIALALCRDSTSNLHLKNSNGQSPLYIACINSSSEVIRELLRREPDFFGKEQTLLHDLVRNDNLRAIELLLSNDFDQFMTDEENRTPLKLAEDLGQKKIADRLRQHRTDVEKSNAPPSSDKENDLPEKDDNKGNASESALGDKNQMTSDSTTDI